jgi:hypothetical protein
MIASALLCFGFMWFLAEAKNPRYTRHEKLVALQGMEVTIFLILLCVIGAGTGAFLILRRAKHEYRQEALDNMRYVAEIARAQKKTDE